MLLRTIFGEIIEITLNFSFQNYDRKPLDIVHKNGKGRVTWCHLWNKDKPAMEAIWGAGQGFQASLVWFETSN